MAMSELQLGLAGAGAAVVIGILAYNKVQERKHRRDVERTVGVEHGDPLLEPRTEPGEGIEPEQVPPRPVAESPTTRSVPEAPLALDECVDCIVRIECVEPLPAASLWAAQAEHLAGISKPVRWFALDETASHHWVELGPLHMGEHHWFCAGMQLVDRRGPISEADFLRFAEGVQAVADTFMAIPASIPTRVQAMENAALLDQFCEEMDIQIGINVIANSDDPLPGTKLRGLAEAQGLVLEADGLFHVRNEHGVSLYTVANLEGEPFSAEKLRTMGTRALTLMLDVPRVSNGVQVFDRMMTFARKLAGSMGGRIVDDNRAPFDDAAAALIRDQIRQFQAKMEESGVPAGSEMALRLFAVK